MIIDVSDLLVDSELGATTFTRERPTVTLAGEGEAVTTYTSNTLTGIVQPAATADAHLLPEGVRLSDVQAFFTSGDVSAGDGAGQLPDVLQYNDESYRVLHVQQFSLHGLTKALAQRFIPGDIPSEDIGGA